jgi:hypothetical protein
MSKSGTSRRRFDMAEKRMICKSISVSEDVNFLPDIFDMLLFTWMIPHSDDFGRLPGSPAKVKAIVVPMLDKSVKEIEDSLQRLQGSSLINWYEISGEKFIQLITFEKHQSGLHKRTKSKYPEFPRDSRNFPEIPLEGKGTEQKGIGREEEGKGREMPSPDSNPHKDSILKMINECEIQDVTLYELDIIYSYIGVCDIEVIESCIKKGQAKHINYAIKTLKGRVKDGIIRKEQLNPIEVGEYDAKQYKGQFQPSNPSPKEYVPDPELLREMRELERLRKAN